MSRPSKIELPTAARDPRELTEYDAAGRALVTVDPERCRRMADLVASKGVPAEREDVPLQGLQADTIANFFFFIVAICHQTSPQGRAPVEGSVGGQHRVGWDYLVARFEEKSSEDPSWLNPRRWCECSATDVELLFKDEALGNRLTGIEIRSRFVRDLGNKMRSAQWASADDVFSWCQGRIKQAEPNLIDTLGRFEAYRDPVWKKSLFFLALMKNCGHWNYVDPEALGPPVDYHELRGHLRLQTVRVIDPTLLRKLRMRTLVNGEEDVALRRTVFKAIMLISEWSGVREPSRLHYLFWNLFRAVCVRMHPRCVATDLPPMLPQRYSGQLDVAGAVHCPYESICPSARTTDPILEPIVDTDYY